MRVLVTDAEYASLDIETDVLGAAGHELRRARCTTAQDVIEAAGEADALLVQYAPIPAEVLGWAATGRPTYPVVEGR